MITSNHLQSIEERMYTASDLLRALYRNGRFARRGDGWLSWWQYDTIIRSLNDIPTLIDTISSLQPTRISELLRVLKSMSDELTEYRRAEAEGRILPEGVFLIITGDGTHVSVSSDTHAAASL